MTQCSFPAALCTALLALLPTWAEPGKTGWCGCSSIAAGMSGRRNSGESAGSVNNWCLHPTTPDPARANTPPASNRAVHRRIVRVMVAPAAFRTR